MTPADDRLTAPRLSVVIATYNRAAMLRACLEALARQTQPAGDFEVVVVDDGSEDGTGDLLATFAAPYALRALRQPNEGQPAALNRGIAAARGTYCLLLDDDIAAAPALLAEHMRAQEAGGGVVALGQLTLTVPRGAGWLVERFGDTWRHHYALLNEGARKPTFMDCWSGNLSVPRAALAAAGGFATDLARAYDVELAYRLVRQGLALVYVPRALADQDYSKGPRGVLADSEKAGAASVALYRRHPATLPHLTLGRFGEARPPAVLLRRLLLAARVPLPALALLARAAGRRRGLGAYRFVHHYAFWRGVRRAVDGDTWRRLARGTTVLMYHAVAEPGEAATRYVIPPARLTAQLRWLWRRGYRPLAADEYLRHRAAHTLPPARSVVVTFDDGYVDNLAHAVPVLRRAGVPATFFLVSGALGARLGWTDESPLAGRPLVSAAQARELAAGGMTVGAHTRTHPDLTTLDADAAWAEVHGSREDLARELGDAPRVFAYPYGRSDAACAALAARAGFAAAFRTGSGVNSPGTDAFALRRIEVRGTEGLARFALHLWRGYGR